MSNTAINTAQNVNINYNVASLGTRIIAFLIDMLFFIIYLFIVNYFIYELSDIADDFLSFGLSSLLTVPVFCYTLYMNILFNGRTLGKFIMQLKTVKEDGSPATWSDFLVSWLLRFVDIWLPLGAIAVIGIVFTDKRQRVGDAASRTIVIDTRKNKKISHTILEDVDEHYEPTFMTVNNLTDRDINEVKEIYRLAGESRDYKALNALRVKVEEILEVKSELRDGVFIRTVLKDYTYLTQGR